MNTRGILKNGEVLSCVWASPPETLAVVSVWVDSARFELGALTFRDFNNSRFTYLL